MKDIEYLSLYLPYDLQLLENCDHWFDPIPDRIVTMTGLLDTDLKLPQQYDNEPIECFHISYRVDEKTTGNDYSKYFKPLLYPLSMLTEEIEHEREKVILLEKLFKEMYPNYYFPEFNPDDVWTSGEVFTWSGFGISARYQYMTFSTIQFMARHHVDFARLIDQGKAIDKSKL